MFMDAIKDAVKNGVTVKHEVILPTKSAFILAALLVALALSVSLVFRAAK